MEGDSSELEAMELVSSSHNNSSVLDLTSNTLPDTLCSWARTATYTVTMAGYRFAEYPVELLSTPTVPTFADFSKSRTVPKATSMMPPPPSPLVKNDTNTNLCLSSQDSCVDDCSVLDCPIECNPFCDGSEACNRSACLEPSRCSSIECCREPRCVSHSRLNSRRQSIDFCTTDVASQDSSGFMGALNDPMLCRWLLPDQQCDVSAPTKNALSQHIFHDHVDPQTLLTCKWDQCADLVDAQQLTDHLWHDHNPDTYVCLWYVFSETCFPFWYSFLDCKTCFTSMRS